MSIGSRRTVQIALAGIILTALAAYGVFQSRTLLEGPQVAINHPHDGATVRESMVRVKGSTENISSIAVNGRTIHVTKNGIFQEPIVLSQGYNVVTIKATDRFGRSTTNELEIVHKPMTGDDSGLSQTQGNGESSSAEESSS